ncbi:hypothetical protein [Ruminococcus sp.]|uniref:hypothetical protein n=1 Tax=Ruminococcus sp. TaxID=41978 RepID=UPI0025F6AF65|nr:hypothetical protein [Ruminococcus sp.]
MNSKRNMTMLILSCDGFSDLWDGHVKLLEQNWPDRNMDTYIVTDKPSDKDYPNVGIISAGEGIEWSERLKAAIEHVKTDYVFITLDDYYLIKKVSDKSIGSLLKMMIKENVDYVRLFNRPKKSILDELEGYKGIHRINTKCNYSVNLYSGLWKKDFILAMIKEPQNAWQFEVALSKRANEYGAKCVMSQRNEFKILDVVRKGKLLHNSYYYFKRHPGIYTGDRAVNTIWYELKLGIKTILGRCVSGKPKRALKKVLRKFGFEFFTE